MVQEFVSDFEPLYLSLMLIGFEGDIHAVIQFMPTGEVVVKDRSKHGTFVGAINL